MQYRSRDGDMDIKNNIVYVTFKETRKAVIRKIKLSQYLGDDYGCPVCGVRLKSFKPIWKSYRRKTAEMGYVYPLSSIETFNEDAYSCPSCDASDRERLFALFFDEVFRGFDQGPRRRLVEFAPSTALRRRLSRHPQVAYRSADIIRQTVDDRVDITDMALYPNNSIDIFLCSHVLEHVEDDRKAMQEMFRALRPGGFAVVMVPLIHGVEETHEDPAFNTPELRWKYFGQDDHVRQYGKTDFVKRLTSAGFHVDQLGADYFGPDVFRRAGIAQDSILYVARKTVPS